MIRLKDTNTNKTIKSYRDQYGLTLDEVLTQRDVECLLKTLSTGQAVDHHCKNANLFGLILIED